MAEVLKRRGEHPGLVDVISVMEACGAYQAWHNKQTHKTFVRPDSGKCLHYYFYFIDAELGLVYLRVPTWAPFRLQFYCNGHSWLARQLTAEGTGFTAADTPVHQPRSILQQSRIQPLQIARPSRVHQCNKGLAFQASVLLKKIRVAPSGAQRNLTEGAVPVPLVEFGRLERYGIHERSGATAPPGLVLGKGNDPAAEPGAAQFLRQIEDIRERTTGTRVCPRRPPRTSPLLSLRTRTSKSRVVAWAKPG